MHHLDMNKSLGVIWMFLVAAGVILGLLWYAGTIPLQLDDQMISYSNPQLGISLLYPSSWDREESGDRYVGRNGFFGIDAVSANEQVSVETVARDVVNHRLRPYGAAPHIVPVSISGQEARLIYPSADQDQNAGVLIAAYPRPVTVGDRTYTFFVLYADVDHLQTLAESVTFLSK